MTVHKSSTSGRSKSARLALRYALLCGALACPLAQAAPGRTLQAIDVTPLGGDRVQVTLTLSEPAPEPVTFTVDNPARLSLDFADTALDVPQRYQRVNAGNVRAVAAAAAKGRTRVVVEMTELAPYTVATQGNQVRVELGSGVAAGAKAAAAVPAAASAGALARIESLDFRRGEKGEGRVVVALSDPHAAVDVREEGGKVVAVFQYTAVPDELVRRLEVLDFATPVKFVDTLREGADTRVVVTPVPGADFEQVAYQSGSMFTLELQPLTAEKEAERKREQPQYTGERISLSFQKVDVRALLQIIADVAGVNMVVSDSVRGEIAMRLQNVPWDQALDLILRTKGLGMRQDGNVMLVAPIEELTLRDKAEAERANQQIQLAPLRTEIIQVNYAKATDIAALLKSGENSIMTERGRVTVDERTNTLLVLESREKIAEIRELIAKLDIPVRQVLIESRIVVANDDFSRDLGTRFGVTAIGRNGGSGLVTTSGSAEATDAAVQGFLNNGRQFPAPVGALDDRFNVSLPATAANAGRIALAVLGRDYLVDLELSALQAEGRGEVISNPRVITANAKQALVEQGREIPFQQSTSSGATSIQFKKAVLSLTVTPQITPDDRIIMDIAVTNDSQGQDVNTGTGRAPAIDTRRLTTQVLVDNGATVVLGGVYEQDQRTNTSKVPLLGDIPLLGFLFRNNTASSMKRELLIFVTPKVLKEGLQVGQP